jgi:hypothetical protein
MRMEGTMPRSVEIPASAAFDAIASGAQFRDLIAIPTTASPEALFQSLREVSLPDMKLAWLLGEIRYLPGRLSGHPPARHADRPFLSQLVEGGTLILRDESPREIITGSAGQLHRVVDQAPVRFETPDAFAAFTDPDHEKLFMSIRVAPAGTPGRSWLVLEHATLALSAEAQRRFALYWHVIKPMGALVSRELLKAIRRRAQGDVAGMSGRSVQATPAEQARHMPGDERIPDSSGSLTHAITIGRPRQDVWPWLAQMGAGSRGGWYSYDRLDNGGLPSASRIVPELQQLTVGMTFPALPGRTDGFTLLAFEPERSIVLGWLSADGSPAVTWAFLLEDAGEGSTRLIVRARGGPDYRFHGLPHSMSGPAIGLVHFVMQRKQLLGIARRVEAMPAAPQRRTEPIVLTSAPA